MGRTNAIIVGTERHDEASVMETTAALEDCLEDRGVQVNNVMAMSTERAEGEVFFGAIIFLLLVMGVPLNFSYSITGVWAWLVLVVILSAVASFILARNASRLTVREVLAYE